MFRQDSLHQPFLNNSDAADQENRNQNIKMKKGKITCQICSNLRLQNQMYAVSENCQRIHSFCYQCLIQRLEESIKKNQDMFCPVDSCPFILTEKSRFFSKLPNNLHNKYVAWKASVQYLGRNKSFRQSRKEEYENYFNIAPQERIQQNQIIQPIEKQNQQKNPIKEKKKKQRKHRPKKGSIDQEIKLQQRQIFILEQNKEAPIPFHDRPQPAADNNIPAVVQMKQYFVEVPYNCKHRFVKFVYIVFGLPLLFIMMGLMLVYMLFIYAFMIGMVLVSMIALVAGGFCLMVTITESNQEKRNKYIVYTLLLCFIQIIGASFTYFFMNHLGGINEYFIKNLWLWWIQKLINIWMYPSPPFVLKQNFVNEEPINVDRI